MTRLLKSNFSSQKNDFNRLPFVDGFAHRVAASHWWVFFENLLVFCNYLVFHHFNTHNPIGLIQKQFYECPYGEYWEKKDKQECSNYRLTLKRLLDAFVSKYEKQDQQDDAENGKLFFHR